MPEAALRIDLPDAIATDRLGAALARAFPGAGVGAVVHLRGELGSGKTSCARSLLQALGVAGTIRSPTYTLVDTYGLPGLVCVHVDLYRVQTLQEVDELGLGELTGPGYLMLIEWPEQGGRATPPADLMLQLKYAGAGRNALLGSQTDTGAAWLDKLAIDTSLGSYVSNLT